MAYYRKKIIPFINETFIPFLTENIIPLIEELKSPVIKLTRDEEKCLNKKSTVLVYK